MRKVDNYIIEDFIFDKPIEKDPSRILSAKSFRREKSNFTKYKMSEIVPKWYYEHNNTFHLIVSEKVIETLEHHYNIYKREEKLKKILK